MAKPRGRHTSARELELTVRWLEAQAEVKKVILGRYETCRHSFPAGYLRFKQDLPVGIQVQAYGDVGVKKVIVHLDGDRDGFKQRLLKRYPPRK